MLRKQKLPKKEKEKKKTLSDIENNYTEDPLN